MIAQTHEERDGRDRDLDPLGEQGLAEGVPAFVGDQDKRLAISIAGLEPYGCELLGIESEIDPDLIGAEVARAHPPLVLEDGGLLKFSCLEGHIADQESDGAVEADGAAGGLADEGLGVGGEEVALLAAHIGGEPLAIGGEAREGAPEGSEDLEAGATGSHHLDPTSGRASEAQGLGANLDLKARLEGARARSGLHPLEDRDRGLGDLGDGFFLGVAASPQCEDDQRDLEA